MSIVSASSDDNNLTVVDESIVELEDNYIDEIQSVDNVSSQGNLQSNDDIIVVNNWDELQYYCTQTDKDYTLKLKENTNFYPSDMQDVNQQIKIKNNVKIIGSDGSWIGDSSSASRRIHYVAIIVEDNQKVGFTFENVSFKWIGSIYSSTSMDGIFVQMGSYKRYTNVFRNCKFSNIIVQSGHATVVYLKKGNALLDNCSFINCTSNYGVVSVYDPNSVKSNSMIVRNCYFENNYACTEPGCINNCGKLTVYNTTFVKNRSFWWAGAIHTHNHGNTTIYDSKFIDNVAGWNGGALYTYSYLQIYNSVFSGNNCTTNNGGGAIGACMYQSSPHIYIENCLFENNANNCWALDELSTTGTGRGGAISFMDKGSIEVRDTTFVANGASIGAAICAWADSGYGSPDIIIVNNSFINHTRMGDTLNIYISGSSAIVGDNYYSGNSIEFSNLNLTTLSVSKEQATFQITADIKHPSYYDADILDKTFYDVYINDNYVKTVNSTIFSIDFGDLDICNVYVIPTISNRKSNEVTVASTREYIFVSKNSGNDSNYGFSRNIPVKTIKRALQLAQTCQNIILLDGEYDEENININYDVTIKGENDAALTGKTSFITGANFSLKNMNINELNTDTFIKGSGNLTVVNCVFNNNKASRLIESQHAEISKSIFTNNDALIVHNNGFVSIHDSILLNNSDIVQGSLNNVDVDYNWWGNALPNLNINNYLTLNVTSNVFELENNQKASVGFGFYLNGLNKYNNLPEIDLHITSENGTSSKTDANINEGVVFTLTGFVDAKLTASYNNAESDFTFKFLKSNPNIKLETGDVMYGDDVKVTVTTPNDCEGNITIRLGNITQNREITASSTVFTFTNLKAGNYVAYVNYSGDKKYASQLKTANVKVSKYESTIVLDIGAVEVNRDVILTVSTVDSSTGNITLSINNDTCTLALVNSKVNYTIKTVHKGDYLVTAVYNGDEKYLTSSDSRFFEVDNTEPDINVTIDPIVYGENLIVNVYVNEDATGMVRVTADGISNSSKVSNANAQVVLTNVDAGINKMLTVFYSGDDNYFNKTVFANYTITKADFDFPVSYSDIMIGDVETIAIKVPARTTGTFTINGTAIGIPLSGEVEYSFVGLEVGNYTITVTYSGNNYNTLSKTVKFSVFEYDSPQWANHGGDMQNTQKSPYDSTANGEIVFEIPIDEKITGDIVIDSEGNIYITTQSGVYSFNSMANMRWHFTSTAAEGNFSGVAISRDVIVAPKAGDTLFFINQTSGEKYESNIFQGSSAFSPVIDSNSNVYTVSEFQADQVGTNEGYNLVIIPFNLWKSGGNPITVYLGKYEPVCSATVSDNIAVVLSYDSSKNRNILRIIDTKTLEYRSKVDFASIRPVIGDGDVVYVALSDSIVAYDKEFRQIWKHKVTGGVGNHLVLDNQQGIYHVNAKGILYRYDLISGDELKVSDLKITSGILIGSDGNLYVGCDKTFYALDSEGNVLWKSYVGSKITGNPVMDRDGLIYVATEDNKVIALTYAPLKDSNLKIEVADIVEGETVTVTVSINNETTGNVSYTVNGMDYSFDAEGVKETKTISGLNLGKYTVTAAYSGDDRFKAVEISRTFQVRLADDIANYITFDGNSTFSFSLNRAQGNLTVSVNNRNYTAKLINGNASIKVTDLRPGDYIVLVIYSGDNLFDSAQRTFEMNVPKIQTKLNENVVVENIVANITVCLPDDAEGNLTLSIGTKKYSQKITNGMGNILVDDLKEGNYTATLTYSGDDKYETVSKKIEFELTKIHVELNDMEIISPSSTPSISVKLDSRATGRLIVNVDGTDYGANLVDGKASVIVDDLNPGNYTATVTYTGDNRFTNASKTVYLEVPKISIDLEDIVVDASTELTQITVNLVQDATGSVSAKVNERIYGSKVIVGVADINISDLAPGIYDAIISYSGDDYYESASKTISFEVPKITLEFNESTLSVVKQDNNVKFTINMPSDVTGDIVASINDEKYTKTLNKGQVIIEFDGLAKGNYEVLLNYVGDDKYDSISKTVRFAISMVDVTLDDYNVFVENLTVSIRLNEDAKGNLSVIVSGKEFKKPLSGGSATLTVSGLSPGTYAATVVYSGDEKYSVADKDITLTVPKFASNLDGLIVKSNVSVPCVLIDFGNDATGTLTVSVNGKNYMAKVIDGVSIINITGLAPGKYQATVVYSGDDNYTNASKTISFDVPKIDVDLEVVVDAQGNLTHVTVDLPLGVTGTVVVNVNGKDFSGRLVDGTANIDIPGLASGNYTALVTYSGDNNYKAASKTIGFEVPKIKVALDDVAVNSADGSASFTVGLPGDATGTITVTVDGKKYTVTLTNGKATVNIPELSEGTHNITVTYSGDGKYGAITKTSVVNVPGNSTGIDNSTNTTVDNSTNTTVDNSTNTTVVKVDPVLVVTAGDVNVGENVVVNVKTSIEIDKVTVNVNDVDYELVVSNGESSLTIPDLAFGNYTVIARFAGDDRFNEATNLTAFRVLKVNVPVTDETISIPEGNSTEYSISLPEDATGTLTVTVDGKKYTETLTNGKATVNIPELSEGSHNITVTYSGDSKYEAITKTSVVNVAGNSTGIDNSTNNTVDNSTNTTVDKISPVLIVSVNDINVGDSAVVNVKTSVETGKLVVNVNKVDYELVINNGESSLTIPDLAVGNYNVIVRFAGDDRFNEVTNSTAFRVLKVNVPITNETISIPESDSTKYSISLPADATGTLTVTVDGKKYTQTLVNGKATVNIPELTTGSHNITVKYSGDAKYSPITKSSVVVKEHVPVIKLTGSNLNMLYTSGKYFKVKLTIDGLPFASQKVKITIKGKTYTRTTKANGYASLKITFPPKAYTVKANYGNLTITKKVIVKSIISAKNINAKKSAKSVKIKVTLKKVNKKYLKNKKVTLKFNKKTFKAKTNKKGVVTFTIKKNVYNKLKTNKKYAYQIIYGKDKVKKTIKFKK